MLARVDQFIDVDTVVHKHTARTETRTEIQYFRQGLTLGQVS